MKYGIIAGIVLFGTGLLSAQDVVRIDLKANARCAKKIVCIADIADVNGGAELLRQRIAALDVTDLNAREPSSTITQRQLQFRLKLSGIEATSFRIGGAHQSQVVAARRSISTEEIVLTAEAELRKKLPYTRDQVSVSLAQQLLVKLPDVYEFETLSVVAVPNAQPKPGRCQMNVTISAPSIRQVTFPVHLEVSVPGQELQQTSAILPLEPVRMAPLNEILVKNRQRVSLVVKKGTLSISTVGEAQQDGKLGDTIKVLNIDSKKIVSGRISAMNTIEIDLGAN